MPDKEGRTHSWVLFGTAEQSAALCCKEHGIVGYPETPDEVAEMRAAHEMTPAREQP
jgi:hypothetical protein